MNDYWESDEIANKERLGELIAENDALRAKAALFNEAWLALPVHTQEACEPDHAGDLVHAIGLLRRKAALLDVLAARIVSNDWHVAPGINRNEVVIYDHSRGERVHGATLAEAVEKAMEAEGGGK